MTKKEFKIIYDLYFDHIRRYIYYRSGNEELATDIAQETFMKIWEKDFDYHPKKTKSLLYKIALDYFISQYRKAKIETKYLNEIRFNFTEETSTNLLEYQELKTHYEKILADLPAKQRDVFLMNRLEGFTYKEIAERLELSIKAVEKRMSLALGVLKKNIKHQ